MKNNGKTKGKETKGKEAGRGRAEDQEKSERSGIGANMQDQNRTVLQDCQRAGESVN